MENNLIKNETKVFYTVRVNDGLFVRHSEFNHGRVVSASITNDESYANSYSDKEMAIKVTIYTKGTLVKHTRTTVVTEVAEQIKAEVI